MSGAKVIIVRHGATRFNSDDPRNPERLRGWLDLPLTEEGVQEGMDTAQKLSKQKIHKIYSSDMERALHVAALIQGMHHNGRAPDILPHQALRPWHVGAWAGQPVESVLNDMLTHMTEKPLHAPPDGEPFQVFLERWLPMVAQAMDEAREHKDKGAIVLVTHTRNLRTLDGWLKRGMRGTEVDPAVLKTRKHLDTGQSVALEHDGRKWNRRVMV